MTTYAPRRIQYKGEEYRLAYPAVQHPRPRSPGALQSEKGEGELIVAVDYPGETRALYFDPITQDFFAKITFSGAQKQVFGREAGELAVELDPAEAKRFFYQLLEEGGRTTLSKDQVQKLWDLGRGIPTGEIIDVELKESSAKSSSRIFVGYREGALLAPQFQEVLKSVSRVYGSFCYLPFFSIVGWKYPNVPNGLVDAFVAKLNEVVAHSMSDEEGNLFNPDLQIELDVRLCHSPGFGGLHAVRGEGQEIRDATSMLNAAAYKAWRLIYNDYRRRPWSYQDKGRKARTEDTLAQKLRKRLDEVRDEASSAEEE